MHAQALDFVRRTAEGLPPGLRVLEIGSRNINGGVRHLFPGAVYTGIDKTAGDGVDIVTDARDYSSPAWFDVVVCCEVLEHDPEPRELIDCAFWLLKPGGRMIVTAAAPGRAPHNCDGSTWTGKEPYRNIEPGSLVFWLSHWDGLVIEYSPERGDVYATATKGIE